MQKDQDNSEGITRRLRVTARDDEADQLAFIASNIKKLSNHVHPPVPNPAPLGLLGFGLTTALLQLKPTGIGGADTFGVDTAVMGFAMFFGGLLQIIAGISEIRRNNIFGYTAFCLYGGFWMSISTIDIVTRLAPDGAPALNSKAMEGMLFMVSVFTFMLWVMTFKLNMTISLLFFLLGSTCMLLSFGVQYPNVDKVGGYFGIATAAVAFWLAFVELFNDIIGEGKEIIPTGHWPHNMLRGAGAVHVPGRIHGHRMSQLNFQPRGQNDPVAAASADIEEGVGSTSDDTH